MHRHRRHTPAGALARYLSESEETALAGADDPYVSWRRGLSKDYPPVIMHLRLTRRFHVGTVSGSEACDEEVKKVKGRSTCVCVYTVCEFVCGHEFKK